MKNLFVFTVALLVAASGFAETGSLINLNGGDVDLVLTAEGGFVKVLSHTIAVGDIATNDTFDYVNEGGQEILSPFYRFTAELDIADRHRVIFLYQPLNLVTQSRFDDDVTLDGITFEAGQVVDVTYSFPFYRASYLYDFAKSERLELAAGASLQLRNASIRFESVDQTTDDVELVISQNLGPVPILKLRAGYTFATPSLPGAFVEFEADGFYASSAFFNGAAYEFVGSIFDASLRAGFSPQLGFEMFTNVRGLGGGASGTRGDAREYWTESVDGYTDNFLTTFSVTLGARVR